MATWDHNLDLVDGNNLTLVDGNNLIISIPPAPVALHQRRYGQALFPICLVEGAQHRRERPYPFFARQKTIKHRFLHQEALPPSMFNPRVLRRGKDRIVFWTKVFRQHYRVADDSLERFELYLEDDQLPDFDGAGQPVATSATLPFNHTPTPPGAGNTKELWAVVRKRNKYDLLSLNMHPTIVTIDDAAAEELGALTAPEILRVLDGENGEIIVFARYPYGVDRNEADEWELYAELGVDPVPAVDTAVETGTLGAPAADYLWRVATDGLTPGSTYHLMVVVRREEEADGEIGESTVTQFTLAETHDLEESTTWLFGGQDHVVD